MKFLPRAIIAAAGIAVGLAQQPTTAQNSAERVAGSKSLSSSETQFVQETLNDGRQEVEIGQMALLQSSSDAVKRYAQRLVNDHNEADKKLEQIAKEYGVPDIGAFPPNSPAYRSDQERTSVNRTGIDPKTNTPAPGPRDAFDRLSRMAGKEFDRAFAQQMVEDHQKEISKFEDAQKTVMNPDLRAFIDMTLPTLKEHLAQARELNQ